MQIKQKLKFVCDVTFCKKICAAFIQFRFNEEFITTALQKSCIPTRCKVKSKLYLFNKCLTIYDIYNYDYLPLPKKNVVAFIYWQSNTSEHTVWQKHSIHIGDHGLCFWLNLYTESSFMSFYSVSIFHNFLSKFSI